MKTYNFDVVVDGGLICSFECGIAVSEFFGKFVVKLGDAPSGNAVSFIPIAAGFNFGPGKAPEDIPLPSLGPIPNILLNCGVIKRETMNTKEDNYNHRRFSGEIVAEGNTDLDFAFALVHIPGAKYGAGGYVVPEQHTVIAVGVDEEGINIACVFSWGNAVYVNALNKNGELKETAFHIIYKGADKPGDEKFLIREGLM